MDIQELKEKVAIAESRGSQDTRELLVQAVTQEFREKVATLASLVTPEY